MEGRYLLPAERWEFVEEYGIKHVPIMNKAKQPLKMSLQELLKHVEGQSINKGTVSEGRVYKLLTQDISFKVVSNQYLLKSEK